MRVTPTHSVKNVSQTWHVGDHGQLDIVPYILAGCKRDSECPLTLACISRECQDPCRVDDPCGRNAECTVQSHRAVCNCIPQHKGNPYVECLPYECLVDPDCPTTQKCEREVCVDPCACAQHASCRATNHRGICTCDPFYTGDPYGIACTPSKKLKNVKIQSKFFLTTSIPFSSSPCCG